MFHNLARGSHKPHQQQPAQIKLEFHIYYCREQNKASVTDYFLHKSPEHLILRGGK